MECRQRGDAHAVDTYAMPYDTYERNWLQMIRLLD